jgi:hypothetical protein
MKRSEKRLEAKIKKMSREQLEYFARFVVSSVYGDSKENGDIFVDSKRDRDPGDVMYDIITDIKSVRLRPQDL